MKLFIVRNIFDKSIQESRLPCTKTLIIIIKWCGLWIRYNWLRELPFYPEVTQYLKSNGEVIDVLDNVRDLGIIVSNDCSWTPHVAKIVKAANILASWVLSVFRDRTSTVILTLFKSKIRTVLEYCCPVWNSSKISDIQAVENIQRQFTRKISGCKELNYWQRLHKLDLLSLQRRRERYSIAQSFTFGKYTTG